MSDGVNGRAAIRADHITGLVLAGGRGSRLGGVDKGLQPFEGEPLVHHALRRLRPQVAAVALNANRHLDDYAVLGVPVWPDDQPDHPGPLAGLLTGLRRCETPWLLTVPCDSPRFPLDLAAQLATGIERADADVAIAATRRNADIATDGIKHQPVFLLVRTTLAASLADFLQRGERQVARWALQQRCAEVVFHDAGAFFNLNTPADFSDAERARPSR